MPPSYRMRYESQPDAVSRFATVFGMTSLDPKTYLWTRLESFVGKGQTIDSMMQATGLSRGTVQRIKAAKTSVGVDILFDLAQRFGVEVWELLRPSDDAGFDPAPSGATEVTAARTLAVPVLANSGSMGPGDDQLQGEVITGSLPVSPEWAMRTLKPTALRNLRFIHGYGDSMEPTFADGDVLLVDVGVEDMLIDGVYVLEANDRIYVKRVRQRMDGTFEISSDNPAVRTVDVLDGRAQVKCRGRIIWRWNGKKT